MFSDGFHIFYSVLIVFKTREWRMGDITVISIWFFQKFIHLSRGEIAVETKV